MGKLWKTGKKITDMAAIACIWLLLCTLFLLFVGGFDFYKAAEFIYSYAGPAERVFLCLTATVAFGLLYLSIGKLLSLCNEKALKLLLAAATLLALALQAYFLFYVRCCYKWDSGFVIGGAASLAESGSVAQQARYYLSVYPNQNTFVCITAVLIRIGDLLGVSVADRPLLWNVFNTLCMDLSVALSMLILRKMKWSGQPDSSQAASLQLRRNYANVYLMMLLNPFLYLGVSYYYTITLSLPLTMGFILLVMEGGGDKKSRRRFLLRWILAGVLLGIGYELRATAVILAIAAIITGIKKLVDGNGAEWKKKLTKLAVIAATSILVMAGLGRVQERYIGIDTTDTAFPVTHWLMMSLSGEGFHNAEDEEFTASFATKEEKQAAVKARLIEKIDAMSFADYASLVKTKVQHTFGNGMNGYTTFLSEALRSDGIYEVIFGGHKDLTVLYHQGYYLFLLLGILLYGIRWMKQRDNDGFFLLLILLGAILFYVLWEAGEQYSVPFMMIMSLLGWSGFSTSCPWITGEKSGKSRMDREKMRKYMATGALVISIPAAALLLVWGVVRYPQFTEIAKTYSYKAAIQVLANEPLAVDDGQVLCQTVKIKRPFNRLVLQWRNPDEKESTAKYRVELCESGKLIYAADIDAEGTGYNGAGIYDFETVVPNTDAYEIVIYKTGGQPQHDLQFVVYDMPGYTPYALGQLSMDRKPLTASLLFSVSEETTQAYTTGKKYIFCITVIVLGFLFMGFWCKLKVSPAPERQTDKTKQ